jgi:hypothetical protein
MELARKPRGDGCDLVVTQRMFNTIITVVDDKALRLHNQW